MSLEYFHQAVAEFRQGHLENSIYYAIKQLLDTPKHPDTIKLLATVFAHQRKYRKAADYIKTLEQLTNFDEELNNLAGSIFVELGEFDQAEHYLNKALEIKPGYTSAEYNLGLLYYNNKQFLNAIPLLSKFIEKFHDHEVTLTILGDCYLQTEDFSLAIKSYQTILSFHANSTKANLGLLTAYINKSDLNAISELLRPLRNNTAENANVIFSLANYLLANNYTEVAIEIYTELLSNTPDNTIVLTHLAMAYDVLESTEKAIDYLNQALAINNNDVEAHSILGNIYTNQDASTLAEKHLQTALNIDSNHIASNINMGRLKSYNEEFDASDNYYFKAISLDPFNKLPYFNLSYNARKRGEYESSCNYLRRCLEIDPSYADAESNLGLTELSLGNFQSGWRHYFKRERTVGEEVLSPITPGMNLSNSHIYLTKSQGIGDELLFLRFLKLLKKNNIEISYRASNKIIPLLKNNGDIDHLVDEESPLPQADYYFTIDDLPLILDINSVEKIPPPLQIPIDTQIKKALKKKYFCDVKHPIIGITWEAGTPEEFQSRKSTTRKLAKKFGIEELVNILKPLSITVVILQRNPKQDHLEYIKDNLDKPVINLSNFNENLSVMLPLLSLIDEYIGVSNTNMHLYAAIGKTAKVLVPHPADWRWLVSGDNSPWLPGFSIYRQLANGDWNMAISQLKQSLELKYGR